MGLLVFISFSRFKIFKRGPTATPISSSTDFSSRRNDFPSISFAAMGKNWMELWTRKCKKAIKLAVYLSVYQLLLGKSLLTANRSPNALLTFHQYNEPLFHTFQAPYPSFYSIIDSIYLLNKNYSENHRNTRKTHRQLSSTGKKKKQRAGLGFGNLKTLLGFGNFFSAKWKKKKKKSWFF